jgi:hypothetical protein
MAQAYTPYGLKNNTEWSLVLGQLKSSYFNQKPSCSSVLRGED